MILFSVIIPVFNGALYLKECLDSLFSQDFKDFEVIVINDGSTDNSEDIVKEYCKVHNNIVLVTIKNSGPYIARKKGIELSKGEYISFVDCDDVVAQNYFVVLSKMAATNSDLILFDLLVEDSFQNSVRINYPNFVDINQFQKYILDSKSNNLVSKIYHKRICKFCKFNYDSYITEEDLLMQCEIVDNCVSISYVNEALYVYKFRNTSTTKSPINFERIDVKFNPHSLHALLAYDAKWNTNMRDKIIANKFNYLYDLFVPIVKKYKWRQYSKYMLKFDFFSEDLLRSFNFKFVSKHKMFLLKPLINRNKLSLWVRTRLYLAYWKVRGSANVN